MTIEWINTKSDKYDYLIAAFSGIAAGVIDIFFVGVPGESILGTWTDEKADQLVMKFAKMTGWNPREDKRGNVASAIGYLEKKFPVNYDQANTTATGGALRMGTTNHHYKSLAHSPDIVGLFFSILDQFQSKSSFLSDGKLIRINTQAQEFGIYGQNFIAKLFCGFCNWLGHIMSDLAGSSGGRGQMTGRGSGLPIPFMEMFQLCDFGELQVGKNRQTMAIVMTEVFQSGYDLRHGATMAIPVFVNELMIRTLWVIKRHFFEKKPWKECIPSQKHSDLRLMLIVGNGALCLMDGADAAIRSAGNALCFILRLNLIAWVRLIILIFKELRIRYGTQVNQALKRFFDSIGDLFNMKERQLLIDYYERMQALDSKLDKLLSEFSKTVNSEYLLLHVEIEDSFNEQLNYIEQAKHSEKVAEFCHVADDKIIRTKQDLDDFFLE